ncbi:LegC family aminotransferase [Enterobacter mori]|jgi:aminotransferase in exopolysaccharide biosynthesis|uniref:LegC family aminotransferase n=1 Tax=Enterobacter mori TaxID=539813 RepID=UPI001CF6212E|nr:LegC family aminotransferase [Enterobacter mori]UCT05895.1 LegC family aminotransferase [Enterobacter mori]
MNADILVDFIRDLYKTDDFIPLHVPTFIGNEKAYVADTIESSFVSSVGKYVDEFERKIESYTKSPRAVATVNGTAALHAALYLSGVQRSDLVITQALTFVATCNAIYHLGAEPVFIDISPISMGLCPVAMSNWLDENAELTESGAIHRKTGQKIRAAVPMHTFGHPVELDELLKVCLKWGITLVEDAAESLGSFYKGRHTGTIGKYGCLSFNGNKIITTGGGGMILCHSEEEGKRTKHVTTTAKIPHPYEFNHDEPGFNYRMPNINAALGCAQIENIELFLSQKRELAKKYQDFFAKSELTFVSEPEYARSNYWLNAVICDTKETRERLLNDMNQKGIMTRPVWKLMHRLPMYSGCIRDELTQSEIIEERLINLPSTPINTL